ncbi:MULTISPECIES: sugar transferase [Liquorilactobacillus]|uniref:Multidrug MFS transporter n=1 Tax=Liquorilactobacillus nagelii TaxID=82688 RepID=A0A3S6R0E1_9LACO|nr:sugar transferase [Liquorilactobacillus nagelii]AUJ31917.1 multidrug MFS transporter [Liquorilactobacillus nagelii]MCC7615696.1 multidrug MFS transporter [Liquorilactobacillus nagelii]MCP9314002.1 sugar transferase [Liquorilactobacillus nagelii]
MLKCGLNEEQSVLDQAAIDHRYLYRALKRVADVALSTAGLIVLSPVLAGVAIAIKVDDKKGPIFYRQERVGRHGKRFMMFKFRSMCVDAEEKLKELKKYNEVEGAMFKMKHDPRVTKVGRFIRHYSIDELPQLFNVLAGDMSLVGPRPPLPRELKEYTEYDKQRLYVIPGCTGLWQVSGRNDVGFHEMVELDLQYISKSGILYDLGIMFRTIKIMVFPNGAY